MNQYPTTASTAVCRKCDRLLDEGAHFCSCGAPTVLATFKERSEYELHQWRSYRAQMVERSA